MTAAQQQLVALAVKVWLAEDDGALEFAIVDDGVGFDPLARGYGTGLQGMVDRLSALGGELRVDSEPGSGTTVTGRLPVAALSKGAILGVQGAPTGTASAEVVARP